MTLTSTLEEANLSATAKAEQILQVMEQLQATKANVSALAVPCRLQEAWMTLRSFLC